MKNYTCRSFLPSGIIALATCFSIATAQLAAQSTADASTAAEIYRARIVPLLQSPDKSSCTECHLRGVELKDFLSTDQAATFAELRSRGWIDIEHPEKSKLLQFVDRRPEKTDPILDRVRKAELVALTTWISAAVKEPELLKQPVKVDDDLKLPLEFIRHARHDQVVARFCEAIWSQLQRCAGCHSPERNEQQVKKHGEQMSWIVPRNPAATLSLLTERGLIDIEQPEQSELRTKPLILVEHGGGPKFAIGGPTDQRWRAFLEDYSKTVRGGYSIANPLPKPLERRSWLSEMQLKLTDLPEEWRGRLLVVSLHPQKSDGSWSDQPIAIGDSPVNRKQLVWQNALTVFQPISTDKSSVDWSKPLVAANVIPSGRYQLRLELGRLVVSEELKPVDQSNESNATKLVATGELEAPWPPGYQPPKILSFSQLKSHIP